MTYLERHGITATDAVARMGQQAQEQVMRNAMHDESLIRPGKLDAQGQVYLIQKTWGVKRRAVITGRMAEYRRTRLVS